MLIPKGTSNPWFQAIAEEREDETPAFILQRDDLLDPNISPPSTLPTELQSAFLLTHSHTIQQNAPVVSFTGPLSTLPDDTLDDLIIRLRSHFHRAGISMLDGILRRQAVSASCLVSDQRVANACGPRTMGFSPYTYTRRRVYSVPRPRAHCGITTVSHRSSI